MYFDYQPSEISSRGFFYTQSFRIEEISLFLNLRVLIALYYQRESAFGLKREPVPVKSALDGASSLLRKPAPLKFL
jgi:hypothetical protein